MMKQLIAFIIFSLSIFEVKNLSICKTFDKIDYVFEYSYIDNFSISKLPNCRFYKIEYNYKYRIDDKLDFAILGTKRENIKIDFNNTIYYGDSDDPIIWEDTLCYFYKVDNKLYLLLSNLHYDNGSKGATVYEIKNGKLIRTDIKNMRIEFLMMDSFIAYDSYYFCGYQTIESKIIINNDGKFEIVGNSKFVDVDRFSPLKFYVLKKELEYVDTVSKEKLILKKNTKIQFQTTDLNTCVNFITDSGIKGIIPIITENVGGENEFRDISGNKLERYFLDDNQHTFDLFYTVGFY